MHPKTKRRLRPPNKNDLSAIGMECVAAFISVVELFTNMIVHWIYGVLAIGGIIVTAISGERYRRKWRKCEQALTEQTQNMLDVKRELERVRLDNEGIRESNKSLAEQIHEYKHLMTSGCRNMKVLERTLPMLANIPRGAVVVAGVDTRRSDLYFPIKTFLYDIDDPEDRDFAIREAEELIETIKKF